MRYRSRVEKAELEAASLRQEMARMIAENVAPELEKVDLRRDGLDEQLVPEPEPGPDSQSETGVALRESEFRGALSMRDSSEEQIEEEHAQ